MGSSPEAKLGIIQKFSHILFVKYGLLKMTYIHTHGGKNVTTLLVKYFNDLPGVQRSERNRNEVTFFYVGDLFCIHLGTLLTMKSLLLSPRRFREDFFLKIGILRAKVYTKNVPNIEECNFIPVPLRPLNTKQVIEVLY